MITVSIVSHRHGRMVSELVSSILTLESVTCIIVTLNVPEVIELPSSEKITVIRNSVPKGYGGNHNQAFRLSRSEFFCVLNPDIVFIKDPFPALLRTLQTTGIQLIAPLIVNETGHVEDAAREFPTILGLLKKALKLSNGASLPVVGEPYIYPDWIGGMFMLFESKTFHQLGGFDSKYFMYYEDADICRRLRKEGHSLGVYTGVSAIHEARRDSRKKLRHLVYHLSSMLRFLLNR